MNVPVVNLKTLCIKIVNINLSCSFYLGKLFMHNNRLFAIVLDDSTSSKETLYHNIMIIELLKYNYNYSEYKIVVKTSITVSKALCDDKQDINDYIDNYSVIINNDINYGNKRKFYFIINYDYGLILIVNKYNFEKNKIIFEIVDLYNVFHIRNMNA